MPIGSLIGGIISAGGASAAGNTAANAGNVASQSTINAGSSAADASYQNARNYNPWIGPGRESYEHLWRLSTGDSDAAARAVAGVQGSPYYMLANQKVGANFQTSPGYQFQLEQGKNALANTGSARGMTFSGAQAKAFADYNQGVANQDYYNWLDRSLKVARDSTNDYYSTLSGLTNTGFNATDRQNQTNQQGVGFAYGGYQDGMRAYQQGQNALASSQAASANAIGTGVADTVSNVAGWAGYGKSKGWW